MRINDKSLMNRKQIVHAYLEIIRLRSAPIKQAETDQRIEQLEQQLMHDAFLKDEIEMQERIQNNEQIFGLRGPNR